MQSITEAFQNLYFYIIYAAGAITLVALIVGGILYLTSAGDPEKTNKAKRQILAALSGTVILFSSYLILKTINPELLKIDLPRLSQFIFHPLDIPKKTKIPDLLGRTKEIAERLNEEVLPGIENTSEKINNLIKNCDCQNTKPLCYCTGGRASSSCEARYCYAGPGAQPCPDEREIKENQKNLVAWKDEIIYYKNRAEAESKDLNDEISKILNGKIRYYEEVISHETNQRIIEYFEEKLNILKEEKELKENLKSRLDELVDIIGQITPLISELSESPDQCLINVKDKCRASCKGKCHDYKEGCQPDKCSGGNPCPVSEIQTFFNRIQNLKPQIISLADEIIKIIDELIKLKTIIL